MTSDRVLLVGWLAWPHQSTTPFPDHSVNLHGPVGNHPKRQPRCIPTAARVRYKGPSGGYAVVEYEGRDYTLPRDILAVPQSAPNVPAALDRPGRTA